MTRYAIYFVPAPTSALYKAASEFIGRCIYTGNALPQPVIRNLDLAALTQAARQYGLHATLKAPFTANCSEDQLRAGFKTFAATQSKFELNGLDLTLLDDRFFALTVKMPPEVIDLEERCVKQFKTFARLLSENEIMRRGAKTTRELGNLREWGYHKIFADFRFHITLTDTVPEDHRETVAQCIKVHLGRLMKEPLALDRLALCKQAVSGGPFKVLDTAYLGFGNEKSAACAKAA